VDITPKLADSATRITRYGGGAIWIGKAEHHAALYITPQQVIELPSITADLPMDTLIERLLPHLESCEILLLGIGPHSLFLAPKWRRKIKQKTGSAAEVMDSGAACRTYNVLLSESRLVSAFIIPLA